MFRFHLGILPFLNFSLSFDEVKGEFEAKDNEFNLRARFLVYNNPMILAYLSRVQNPPSMDPQHMEQFLGSLDAKTTQELFDTARLWENLLLPVYRGPFFLVHVADIRAVLHSSATALTLYKEV